MIPKISSEELNNILTNAKGQLDNLDKKFATSKKEMEEKLKIINYESEYVQQTLTKIKNNSYEKIEGMIAFAHLQKETSGKYERYGSTIHAETLKLINVFNLEASAFNEVYFREDVKIAVNDIYDDKNLSLLQHDAIPKPAFFDTYKDKILTIKIELTDLSTILGPTKFNAIEIDPFLHGSFDILETRIYEFTENGTVDDKAKPITLGVMPNVGIQRVILPRKINFYKIEFDVRINYETFRNTSIVYPFGVKHLYLYNMDFRTDSYLIAEIKSDDNIAFIKNDIIVKTPFGQKHSKINLENIELFLDRDDKSNELYTPIEPSLPDDIKEIARNVKTIYARIPIKPETNFIGIAFDIVNRIK